MHVLPAVAGVLYLEDVGTIDACVIVKAFGSQPLLFLIVLPTGVPAHVHIERFWQVVTSVLLDHVCDACIITTVLVIEGGILFLDVLTCAQEVTVSLLPFFVKGSLVCKSLFIVLLDFVCLVLGSLEGFDCDAELIVLGVVGPVLVQRVMVVILHEARFSVDYSKLDSYAQNIGLTYIRRTERY